MILSAPEFEAITNGTHASPHDLLGMHRMPGGGLVVRAFLPLAKGVVAVPVDSVNKPVIPTATGGGIGFVRGRGGERGRSVPL